MDRGEFIKHGFSCRPGFNGGWVVHANSMRLDEHGQMAAFSAFADMIAWLEDQHEGLKIGEMRADGVIGPFKGQPEKPPEPGEDPHVGRIYQHANPPCGYGCNDKIVAGDCPVHGASDA